MKLVPYLMLVLILSSIDFSACSQEVDAVPPYQSFKMESKIMNETRVLNIWLPPGYETSKEAYFVMYMPDGGINEDFPHVANTIADLVKQNIIPPMLLVGIENTQRRRDLTSETNVEEDKKIASVVGGAKIFRQFIKEELMPEIEKRYRTNGQKGILGESLAGFFVVETFLLYPEMFNNYIAFDPSLWWNDHQLLNSASSKIASFPEKKVRIWFAGSGAKDIFQYTNQLAEAFQQNEKSFITWKYSPEKREKHQTIFRATKEKALKWMFEVKGE